MGVRDGVVNTRANRRIHPRSPLPTSHEDIFHP